MSDDALDFPGWLTAMSRALGYSSDSALAMALKVSPSSITRWRKGSQPTVEHLVRLSNVLGVRLEPLLALAGYVAPELIGNAEPPPPPDAVPESIRRIRGSLLSDEDKGELLAFWKKRQSEESVRLYLLIDHYEKRSNPDYRYAPGWALSLMPSSLSQHLSVLLDAMERKPRAKRLKGKDQ